MNICKGQIRCFMGPRFGAIKSILLEKDETDPGCCPIVKGEPALSYTACNVSAQLTPRSRITMLSGIAWGIGKRPGPLEYSCAERC
jgi:hypothetical protein